MSIERVVLIFAGYRPGLSASKFCPFDQGFPLIANRLPASPRSKV